MSKETAMNNKHECQWCGELTDIRDAICTTCYVAEEIKQMSSDTYDREMNAWFESEHAEK
jgi:hypothetical protein